MGWESFGVVGFDLEPLFQGQTRMAKPKSAFYLLIICPGDLQCEPSYRKSWAWIHLMWSDLTLDPSFKVKQG